MYKRQPQEPTRPVRDESWAVSGRGYDVMPYDPNYPDEIPSQTKRRLDMPFNMRGINPLQPRKEMNDSGEVSAQFPVSATTKTPLYGAGYGEEYQKTPLDAGYVAPSRTDLAKDMRKSKYSFANYDTPLNQQEESEFQQWKQKYAPNDTGEDYDLRGAFKEGLEPDPKTGHWPDTYKKPNHPTFSNESQYAIGEDAKKAGHWKGDRFVPPQPAMRQMLRPRTEPEPSFRKRRLIEHRTSADPLRNPTMFEEEGPYRAGRNFSQNNLAEDAYNVGQGMVEGNPVGTIQGVLESHLGQGGYDINQPIPVDYPITPPERPSGGRVRRKP